MKRIFALVLSFAVLFSCLVLPAGAMFDPTPVYQVQAQSAYIVNTDTNIIVYDKDSTKQVSAGGLTKYMTCLLYTSATRIPKGASIRFRPSACWAARISVGASSAA